MRTVTLKITSLEPEQSGFRGEAKVQGRTIIDFDDDADKLKSSLLDDLLRDDEIREGNYIVVEEVEETLETSAK